MSNFLHNAEEVAGQLTVQLCIPDQAEWKICYRFHKSSKADAVAPAFEVQRRKKGNTRARGDQSKETFDAINRYNFSWLEMHSAEYGADPVRVSGRILRIEDQKRFLCEIAELDSITLFLLERRTSDGNANRRGGNNTTS
jgi:hypothetical protein